MLGPAAAAAAARMTPTADRCRAAFHAATAGGARFSGAARAGKHTGTRAGRTSANRGHVNVLIHIHMRSLIHMSILIYMGAFVHTLIVRAADELAILEPSLSEPVSDLHGIYMDVRYARLAERSGARVESIAEAAFAASQRFAEMASHLVSHLERCVSHDQPITGEVIPRGAFC